MSGRIDPADNPTGIGPFGLPFNDVGEVVQSLLTVLTDRGYTRESIVHALSDFNEGEFWDEVLGPAADRLAYLLALDEVQS